MALPFFCAWRCSVSDFHFLIDSSEVQYEIVIPKPLESLKLSTLINPSAFLTISSILADMESYPC